MSVIFLRILSAVKTGVKTVVQIVLIGFSLLIPTNISTLQYPPRFKWGVASNGRDGGGKSIVLRDTLSSAAGSRPGGTGRASLVCRGKAVRERLA